MRGAIIIVKCNSAASVWLPARQRKSRLKSLSEMRARHERKDGGKGVRRTRADSGRTEARTDKVGQRGSKLFRGTRLSR
jgi:hypothetical protein